MRGPQPRAGVHGPRLGSGPVLAQLTRGSPAALLWGLLWGQGLSWGSSPEGDPAALVLPALHSGPDSK